MDWVSRCNLSSTDLTALSMTCVALPSHHNAAERSTLLERTMHPQASCIPCRWATGEGVTIAGALRESEWAAVRHLLAQIVLAFRSSVPGAVDAVFRLQDAHEHSGRSATYTSKHGHASITMETLFTIPSCSQYASLLCC